MLSHAQLLTEKCVHTEQALDSASIDHYLSQVAGWQLEGNKLCKTYAFGNYYETLAFVNGIALIIHREDHHPEMIVTYNRCTLKFDTHSVNGGKGGISTNDFICAAKIDKLAQ
ncbi:MAG: hypothetical protein RL748_2059 [Pseudomonadota bacterium]|jgi:4a-hydroxytetrahydrobiopterin dehydratase